MGGQQGKREAENVGYDGPPWASVIEGGGGFKTDDPYSSNICFPCTEYRACKALADSMVRCFCLLLVWWIQKAFSTVLSATSTCVLQYGTTAVLAATKCVGPNMYLTRTDSCFTSRWQLSCFFGLRTPERQPGL